MAGELTLNFTTAVTLYANIRDRISGYVWNGTTFEAYLSASGNQSSYAVTMTEQGTASQFYAGNMPGAISGGSYDVTVKQRMNAWFAETDPPVGQGSVDWIGSGQRLRFLSDVATSGQVSLTLPVKLTKGVAISGFVFKLVSSVDHVTPLTSGVVSGQISKNGAAYTNLQSGTAVANYVELGKGMYRVNLTSGDMDADVIALNFYGVGVSGGASDNRDLVIYCQKASG